jgi:hypothetical protein
MRTGTKIVISDWVLTAFLLIWLVFVMPLLAVFIPHVKEIMKVMNYVVIVSMVIAQAGGVTAVNEIRKTIENKNKPPVEKT